MTSPPTGSRDISADEISSSRRLARGVGKARARAGDAGVGGRALPSQARSSPPREQRPLTAQACQSGRAHTPQQQAEIDPVLDSEWARAHAETGEREARQQAEGVTPGNCGGSHLYEQWETVCNSSQQYSCMTIVTCRGVC